MSDIPHPRNTYGMEHAEASEQAFLEAISRGRLHHAWLLTGPEGVGKATFAYRAARRLLGGRLDPAFGALGVSPDDGVARQVAARSHPDLLVLERPEVDGKLKRDIPVGEVRRAPEFFSKAPGSAPYRVCIVDAADDMNVSAANALLKTLEEPPERGVLLLVAHSPGRLLATLRSRCRRLAFPAWPTAQAAAFVARRAGVGPEEAAALADMAGGAPGAAWRMAASEALNLDGIAARLLSAPERPDLGELQGLADRFRGGEGMERFALFFERLGDRLRRRLTSEARPEDGMAEAWSRFTALPAEVDGLNLDRGDAFWSALAELKQAARRPC